MTINDKKAECFYEVLVVLVVESKIKLAWAPRVAEQKSTAADW